MLKKVLVGCALALGTAAAPAAGAAPQADPLMPPAVSVTNGPWAYAGVHPADGDALHATTGGWSGIGNGYAYQWQSCTGANSGCTDIAGAVAASYVPNGQFGRRVRVAVTAANADGSGTAYSATTAVLGDEVAHLRAAAPGVDGVPREGASLAFRATDDYAGSPPLTQWVVWQRCTSAGGGCADIGGGNGDTYVPVVADVGRWLRVRYLIHNGAGHPVGAESATVGPVTANTDPPALVTAPEVTGTAMDGAPLQGSAGTWSGGKPIATAFQWLRCEDEACEELPGETSSRYTPGAADVGTRLRLRVTASSPYGTAQADAPLTDVVAPAPPSATAAPALSGSARDGESLTGTPGTWSGTAPISRSSTWERCDADGEACETIAGATGSAYTLTPEDIGHRVRFKELASNAAGDGASRSAASAVVQAIAPAATELPAVSGEARHESVLESTTGTWSGSPQIAYARQWMRCAGAGSPGDCAPIAGATGATYEVAGVDVGSHLRLRVTATNFGNRREAFSEPTAAVAARAPHAAAAPEVSGDAADGARLSGTTGTWKGTGPVTTTRQWERCLPDGACAPIAGATAATYALTSDDVGQRLRLLVTASGPGGTGTAASAPTALVAAVVPQATAPPEVTGTARDGATLTATPGTWIGTTPMQRSLRWERCDDACAPVAGATGDTYLLGAHDVGRRIRVVVEAANAAGTTEAASAPTAVVAGLAPAVTEQPAVTGSARDEETVTAADGIWTGSPQIVFARQWLRCSDAADVAGCEAVPGASAPSLALTDDDVGAFVRVRVTATNAAGAATAHSAAAGPVQPAPPSAVPGAGPWLEIPGDADQSAPDVGDRVVVRPGTWAGTDRSGHATTFAYRWERCTTGGCAAIDGRDGGEAVVTAADAGSQLRVVVTATNPSGSAGAATPRLGVTRGGPLAAAQPAPAPAPVAAAGGTFLLPPGSLLAPASCAAIGRATLRAAGVTVTVPAGVSSAAAPLLAKVSARAGTRRVRLSAGGRALRLRRAGRGRFTAALAPAALAKAQLLQLAATPRRGKPGRASARLGVKPCDALLTARLSGTRLTLRVDQRTPLGRVAFTLPKGLALKLSGGRAGSVESLAFGSSARTLDRLAAAAVRGRTVVLERLPPATSAVTVTLALAGKGRRGTALRFAADTGRRLSAQVSVRR